MSSTEPKPGPRPSAGNPIARSHVEWRGTGLLFQAGVGDRTHAIDADSKTAPSPVETLLGSVATCAASDVVEILAKQRTPASRLHVDVLAIRRVENPRRVETLELTFTIDGAGVERAQAQRAIDLSVQKYCTVAASLAGDIAMTSLLVLNGERGDAVEQPMYSKTGDPGPGTRDP